MAENVDLHIRLMTHLQGMAAYQQLSKAMGGIAKQAGLANLSIGKMVAGGAALVLGFKGIEAIGSFMKGMREEATAAVKAEEKLGIALSRNPKLAKMGAAVITDQQQKLIELADKMEVSGVVAATSLKAGFAGLSTAGFGPASIGKMSKGFEGMVVALKGVGASAADVGQLGGQIKAMIKLGAKARFPMEWKKILSAKDLDNFKKANNEVKRAAWVRDILAKQEWRVQAALGTTEGKVWRAGQAWRRLQETLGKPFVETQTAWAEASGSIADAMLPTAQLVAAKLTPALKALAGWVRDIVPNLGKLGTAFEAVRTVLQGYWDATGFTAQFDKITGIINDSTKKWSEALKPAFDPIVTAASELWGKLSGPLNKVGQEVQNLFKTKQFLNPATGSYEALQEKPDFGPLKQAVTDAMNDIGNVLKNYDWAGLAVDVGKGAFKAGQNIGKMIVEGLTDLGSLITQKFNEIPWGDIWTNISTNLQSAGASIADAFSQVDWNAAAKSIGEGIGTAIKGIVIGGAAIAAFANNLSKQIADGIVSTDWATVIDNIGQGIYDAMDVIWDTGVELAASLLDGIVKGITGQDMAGIGTALVKGFNDAFKLVMDAVGTWGPAIVQAIISGLGGLAGAIGNMISGALASVGGKGGSMAVTSTGKGAPSPQGGSLLGRQYGGVVTTPSLVKMAERGSEMVIPMQGDSRSRGLLSSTASALGMGGMLGGRGGGDTHLSMSVPITVNGATAGQEGSIGREIQRALQDPINTLLAELKKAKEEERRLSYV